MRPVVIDRVTSSVSLSVTAVSPAKTTRVDRDAICVEDSGGPKEPCIRWGSRLPHAKGHFLGERTCAGMPNDTLP